MKFKYEPIIPIADTVFKKKKQWERECLAVSKDQTYRPKSEPEKVLDSNFYDLQMNPQKVFEQNHSFEWELFQWADSDFVHWVQQQPPTMVLAVMANMKQSPRLSPALETLRQRVHLVPFCSLEDYAKKRRLGERSVFFLKEMQKRYGDSILRIFYLTYD